MMPGEPAPSHLLRSEVVSAGSSSSALGRIGITTVAVALANAAVTAMHDELTALVPGDAAGFRDSLGLGPVHRGRPAVTSPLDGPPVTPGYNVLILARHLVTFSAQKRACASNSMLLPTREHII